jgi:dolichol-phosphate mannosyltransferase
VDEALTGAGIIHEILVVNDNSRDRTEEVLNRLAQSIPALRYITNKPPNGFGYAVRAGLAAFRGDAVAIVMADSSDSPQDLVAFYHKLQEGYECVFGSRFIAGGKVIDYPLPKLLLNRLANFFIRVLFWMRYNDVTNAFKLYRRSVIAGLQPLLAYHFNLTVELPLKSIVRGYTYAVVPTVWYNRTAGVSKFRIKEMGSRYLFIVFYCYLEKYLTREDYRRRDLRDRQLQVWSR